MAIAKVEVERFSLTTAKPFEAVVAYKYPPEVDEFNAADIEKAPSMVVRPPRVARAPVAMNASWSENSPSATSTITWRGDEWFVSTFGTASSTPGTAMWTRPL